MSNEFIESNIRGNRIQSGVLILALICVLALIGLAFGGVNGLIVAAVVGFFVVVFGPKVSPQIVLRMYKAQLIPRQSSPELHDMFSELVQRADLDIAPKLYYIPSRTLNAFACGTSKDAAVAITDGLLRILNPREIAGVLAHEISHVRHRDMHVLGIADSVSRLIASVSRLGQLLMFVAIPMFLMKGGLWFLMIAALLMFSPIISNLLQLALSRSREFNADLGAVSLTGDAIGLASALKKLERINSGVQFPWIVRPQKTQSVPALLRTHPPTEERVRRILEAGESLQQREQPAAESQQRRLAPLDHQRVRNGPSWHIAGLWR